MDLLAGINGAERNEGRDQLLGQQIVQGVDHVAILIFGKVRKQTGIQRGLVQSGLKIDARLVFSGLHIGQMSRGREDQRTRQTKVGKHHFPKILVYRLTAFGLHHSQKDVFQGEALKRGAKLASCHQRNQGGLGGLNPMPYRLGKAEAVSVGARQGVGSASRAKDHGIGSLLPIFAQNNTADASVLCQKALHSAVDRRHACLSASALQGGNHVYGLVGNGKDPSAPLGLERYPNLLKKSNGISGREARERGV